MFTDLFSRNCGKYFQNYINYYLKLSLSITSSYILLAELNHMATSKPIMAEEGRLLMSGLDQLRFILCKLHESRGFVYIFIFSA